MISTEVVDLSRLQFAATALYHFLFVPLTLGLGFILAAMETVYVITKKKIYKEMTIFWGKLFAINFALGVATGLTMEFEFGTNWSFYSHYVGDIFGAPLAIEGLMAFFLESTFVGLMIFGWKRLSPIAHLVVTFMAALGANLSALWILVANGFMQHPVGAYFDPATLRMQLHSFSDLIFSQDAQSKFVHTTAAGYVTASVFVMGISAWYMLKNRHLEVARRSFRLASLFGVISIIAVITLGDALGYFNGQVQPSKLAAMEALWETEPAPAGFNLIAFPDMSEQKNSFTVQIPYVLTPLVTHTLRKAIPGIKEIQKTSIERIKNGIPALLALQTLSKDPGNAQAKEQFQAHKQDLGYALLLQRYAPEQDVSKATDSHIERAARDTVPYVPVIFWSFRLMVAAGFAMVALFILSAYYSLRNMVEGKPWLLKFGLWMIPVPFIASEAGWITTEMGRQPWAVYGMLPTWNAASSHSLAYMVFSLIGFVVLYSIFIAVEMYLMLMFARGGPGDPDSGSKGFDDEGAARRSGTLGLT
jgi:cytochrome d ubiquinol oxidase subunit I